MGKRRGGSEWTPEDEAFLRANYGVLTTREIATEMGRGFPAVTAKITILRLARINEWTKEQDAFLRAHADKGWPWCAAEMGRSVISIYNRVRRLGIQRRMLSEDDLEQIKRLHGMGLSTFEIAAQLGVS